MQLRCANFTLFLDENSPFCKKKQEASHRVSDGGPEDLKEGTIAPGDGDPSRPPVPGTVLLCPFSKK